MSREKWAKRNWGLTKLTEIGHQPEFQVFGINSCDNCKRSVRELGAQLTDIRKDPLPAEKIAQFLGKFGDDLINKRSTTWRGLSEAECALPAAELLARHPTVMKRPVIETPDGTLYLGWGADVKARLL